MNIEHVPMHRLYRDDDHIAVEFLLEGRRYRAEFAHDGTTATFEALVELAEYEVTVEDATLESVPAELREALVRRGFELEAGDSPADESDEDVDDAAKAFGRAD
jgi:hypothetical protein